MIDLRDFNRTTVDFKRDYTASIVEFIADDGGESNLMYINAIGFEGNIPTFAGSLMGRGGAKPPSFRLNGAVNTFKEWFPEPMMYNTNDSVLSLSYRPARQYCRSYNRDIAVVSYPDAMYAFGYPSGTVSAVDNRHVTQIYNNIDFSFEEGIAQITQGERIAFRLFGYFYCMLHPTDKAHPIKIMCDESYIGFVDGNTGHIRLFKGAVFLRDVFRDNGYADRMAS